MPWYEEALQKSTERQSRTEAIYREAEKVYEAIWSGIIEEANQLHSRRQQTFKFNGSAFERIIEQLISPRYDRGEEEFRSRPMMFVLTADRKTITATAIRFEDYPPAQIEFDLEQSKDGVVRAMYKGTPVETHQAAVMVLRHFLFPDLPIEYERRLEPSESWFPRSL